MVTHAALRTGADAERCCLNVPCYASCVPTISFCVVSCDARMLLRRYPRLKDDLLNHIRTQLLQELGFAEDKQVLEKSW